MPTVAITGASGTMGKEAIHFLTENPALRLRVLLRTTRRGKAYASKLRKRFGKQVEILYGDIRNYDDCLLLTKGADYLLHMAAVIPPLADHDEALTMSINRDGTQNLINAVIENGNTTKFIFISTVAIYGNRNEKHPWGRVGDPLVTSAFDVYGLSKTIAEFNVMESGLAHWSVLRQTAVLYDNILVNNISDGLMFHTPWNALIEWVTAKDSGILLANIVQKDQAGEIDDFWKKVYNIGGGVNTRETGYETFDGGFRLIGGSVKRFFLPHWNLPRNFHCFWFSDSDMLEEMFHFRTQSCADFWRWYKKKHFIYALGRIVPPALLRKMVLEPLLKNSNAPAYWHAHRDAARIQAYYGGWEAYESMPDRWENVDLLCEKPDYAQRKHHDKRFDLDHGYDENKPDSELDIADLKQAAAFRGGKCLSDSMTKGDLYTKHLWQCSEGHCFEASPYTILKAGHWCPQCCQSEHTWQMDRVAKHSPFHAQIWLDSHNPDELYTYRLRDGKAEMERAE